MQYSYLPPIKNLTVAIMREFQIEHYLELLNSSNCVKLIIFLYKQILLLLNIPLWELESELLRLQFGL